MSQLRHLSTAAAAAQYTVCKSVNVSASQLFKTVADVDDYDKFLPFCHHSKVTRIVESSNSTKFAFEAELTIGFPNTPFLTQYRSHVELDKAQKRCTIEAIESTAFDNLRSTWNISEGKGGNKNVCTVNFHVEYQSSSAIVDQFVNNVFEEVAKRQIEAFERRAQKTTET
ncbi:hypothetical protein ScalyP_jg4791 [Parmales sp. scaly parma]|nr:hypothetical protein ScalyP_jg4791 [Parmales sp. scaly parma]